MTMQGAVRCVPLFVWAILCFFVTADLAVAGGIPEIDKLVASNPGNDDLFGGAMAVDGDTLAVGAPGAGSGGRVYIFERQLDDSWAETQLLTPSDVSSLDDFGFSVAIDGDVLAVGNPNADGEVWVFERDMGGIWQETAQLFDLSGESDDLGFSVAVAGNVIAAGAPGTPFSGGAAPSDFGGVTPGTNAGAVYVFAQDGLGAWGEVAQLTDPEWDGDIALSTEDLLGYSVAMTADRIVAGAPHINSADFGPGSVLIFSAAGGGTFEDRLPSPIAFEGFGTAVAIAGETIVVGELAAIGDAEAFVYELDAGSWVGTELIPSGANFRFGVAVDVLGDQIAVGAQDGNLGIAYTFERDGASWSETAMLVASDGMDNDDFGEAVAVGGGEVFVGAPEDDEGPFDESGAVYVYGGGAPAVQLSIAGTCPGTMTITVETAEPNTDVLMVFGRTEGSTPIPSGGCAGVEMDMEPIRILSTVTTDGSGVFQISPTFASQRCGTFLQGINRMCVKSNLLQIPDGSN